MIIARCPKCNKDKEFSANAGRSNGRGVYCKECQKAHQHAWYLRHKADQLLRVRDRQQRLSKWIESEKNKPCKDCGGTFPSCCMDFDHVRGKKKFNLSMASRTNSISAIKAELSKCEVVCANCHRIRTKNRRV